MDVLCLMNTSIFSLLAHLTPVRRPLGLEWYGMHLSTSVPTRGPGSADGTKRSWCPALFLPVNSQFVINQRTQMQLADKVASVFQGKLMSPREMNESISGSRLADTISPKYRRSWYLCGDVSEEFYQLAVSGNTPGYAFSAFTTPGGTVFATFVLQLRNHQARFLLPFATEKSARFIEQAARTGIYLSLGRNGGREALLVEFACVPELLGPMQTYSEILKGLPRDIPARDLQIAGQYILTASDVPSAHPHYPVVEQVCMTVILGE